jgi:hypothetical protein
MTIQTTAQEIAAMLINGLVSVDEAAKSLTNLVTNCPHTELNPACPELNIPAGEYCVDCGKTQE